MNRPSDQFALPRQLRRRIQRQLRKLFRRNVCSICGGPFKHNSRTAGGLDAQGNVVLAGECCLGKVAKAFTLGLYSELAESDKVFDDIVRRGGDTPIPPTLNLLDLWKNDDRDWFRRNEQRSHRVRMPFPGEADEEALDAPAGHALMILLQQTKPGRRIRAAVHASTNLLPLPDDEAAAHALFEVAMGREVAPPDREALGTLVQKYKTCRS